MKRSLSVPAAATASGVPTRLGKYELLMPLAAGGMARIYIGRSTGIGAFERHVVLKLITPERANDHIAVQMFLDEARLAASLNHQNVAQVFEVGEDVGIHYLAMEYVHGQDLRALLAKAGSQGTRIPLDLALTVVAGAAAGLHHAHERRGPDGTPLGIVHRDVSPSNIMIGYDGAVKLLDFGIAKATSRSVETQSGIIKGKFAYMAPEQCRGREVDRRSDVFSLGIILYEISTQHRCFRADSDFDTMHRIVTGDVVRPTRLVPGYPQALEAIVMKALAVDATTRYQSAGQLLEAIESFAVSARMSLSTMGLGRFMRDMFGEVQEPWLATSARGSQPVMAKESTISSTDGRSDVSAVQPGLVAAVAVEQSSSGVPTEEGAFPDSARNEMAKTILDLPRANNDRTVVEDEEQPPDWNARSYPPPQPLMATDSRPPEPPETAPQRRRTPGLGIPQQGAPMPPLAQSPAGTLPPATQQPPMTRSTPPGALQVPQNQFSKTPSSSSKSSPAIQTLGQPIPSTRHGYAGGAGMTGGALGNADMSYPRYEPRADSQPIDIDVDLDLKPNRKPLIIGIVVLALGVGAILFVKLGGSGGNSEPTAEPPGAGSDIGSAAVPAPVPTPGSGSAEAQNDTSEDMISIHVDSKPTGADVILAGTKLGITPLDKKLRRGTSTQIITVHLTGYVDATTKIDLSGDNSKNVTLKTPAEAAEEQGSAAKSETDDHKGKPKASATPPGPKVDKTVAPPPVEHPKADKTAAPVKTNPTEHKTDTPKLPEHKEHKQPKCQPPGPNVDPFSSVPVCSS
jgi:serine/threonine protein kinase